MIKNIKEHADYFLPEMPKWITHYGFALMIVLLIGFLGAASLIEYSDNQRFDVILTKTSHTAKLDFTSYKKMKHGQPFMVSGPFQHSVRGYLEKKIVAAKDNYVIVPAVIPDAAVSNLPIDGQLKLNGSFKISKGSLLQNLVKAN
jgi:hypothetical protein